MTIPLNAFGQRGEQYEASDMSLALGAWRLYHQVIVGRGVGLPVPCLPKDAFFSKATTGIASRKSEGNAVVITARQVVEIQQCMSGSSPTAPQAKTERERYHIGAVWHGNWYERADAGRFGSPEKLNHFACISFRNQVATTFTLAPITSKERSSVTGNVMLPPGTIPCGEFCTCYILYRIKLRASRQTLDMHFKYRATLHREHVQEMRTRMNQDVSA
jgi:hypothetical protein